MTVAIEIDVIGAARVQRILSRLSQFDTDKLLDNIGNVVANQTRRRILHDKKAPDGSAWEPLSDDYAKAKASKKGSAVGMLEYDGALRDSITHLVRGDETEVGSNMAYAAAQQLGFSKNNLPARPYLGLSADDGTEVEEVVEDWIAATLGVRL